MKWYYNLTLTLLSVLLTGFILLPPVEASSTQAYQDYVYQLDKYRASYNEYKIAKNEYDKFKTLTSQTTALEKTKDMLNWRDILLRAYLILLKEKINENPGFNESDKVLYTTLIDNENKFLETHSGLIPSIGSLADAVEVSKQLESHYVILQTSIRQTLLGLSVGQMNYLNSQFKELVKVAATLLDESRLYLPITKLSVADRWVVSINAKQSLFDQKMSQIQTSIATLKGRDVRELDEKMVNIQKSLGEAKTYLQDGNSFLRELLEILRYKN